MVRRQATAAFAPLLYVLGGSVVLTGYYLVPEGHGGSEGVWKVALYCVVSASAAVAVLAGILWHRPTRPLPWLLILASQAIYAAADVTFYVRHYLLGLGQYPAVSDVLYLLHYAPLIAAMFIFIRRRTPRSGRSALLDGGVIAVTAALLSYIFVIAPSIGAPGQSLVSRLTSAAYPVMDVLMLAFAMWLLLGAGKRSRSYWLLLAALVLLFATDTVYALEQIAGTFQSGGFLDGLWVAYYLLIGASMLDPSMVELDRPSPVHDTLPAPSRYLGIGLATMAVPAALLIQGQTSTPFALPVIAVATALLFVLVILRLWGMVSEQRQMAITDSLTGLPNRRYFEHHLAVDSARAERSGEPISLALLDIDFFKSVNDGYGHGAGDRVLAEVGDRLRQNMRAGDVLARYGGEEFAVLLYGVGLETARATVDRLRHAVDAVPFEVGTGMEIPVSVSAGLVSYPDHVDAPGDLMAAADRAMYAAKGTGRDRLVVGHFDPPPSFLRHGPANPVVDYLEALADRVDLYQAPVEHGTAIARWVVAMAHELGLDDFAQRRCNLAARLHDIGKVAVPMHILTKDGRLTPDDWQFIRDHPAQGELVVSAAPGMRDVAEIIGQHHERVDGTGYPSGLRGTEIRIEARILSVCDAFASMRAARPYRLGLSEDESVARLLAGRNTQHDGELVDLFVRLLGDEVVGHLGELSHEARVLSP